ncbi:hypothetical protein QYF36_013993 [Acer negundo]|nr:hypothetical protein QYF36_013993 [Acer negundo]
MESGVKRHRLKQGHQEPLPLGFKKQLTAKSSKSLPRAAVATTKKGEHIREGAGREDPSEMTAVYCQNNRCYLLYNTSY